MTSFASTDSASPIDVQLHYDHVSRTAYVCSSVFDGVLPSRFSTREAAADAARMLIAGIVNDDADISRRYIRIWFR